MRVAGKEAAREAQNRGRGYCRVAGPARSGPGVALASLMSIFAQDLDPGLRPGSVASRCWTVFSLRVRRTRIADIASDTPLIWGSPQGDDDRNGPARLCLLFIHPPAHGSEVSPAARNTLDSARIPRTSKLLICGLFQKGRVLAQDAVGINAVFTQLR